MVKLMNFDTEEKSIVYVNELIDKYDSSVEELSNIDVVKMYFGIMIHYLYNDRPRSERTMESVIKLLGATKKERGYRYPFFVIMTKNSETRPEDVFYQESKALENTITMEDINEIYRFVEWGLLDDLKNKVDYVDECENLLGQLALSRVQMTKGKKVNVVLRHRSMAANDLSSELQKKCAQFVEEYPPQKMKAYLDRFIIGQDDAKKAISTAIYNHYLRVLNPEAKLIKSNVIMIGPSGCGKTEIIRRIIELVDLPVIISDFSGVVATPWKGRNKEEALYNLYLKAGQNLELAQNGIIFYDEFDKIIPVRKYVFGGDINHELQGQMLGMMEGTTVDVPIPGGRGEKITMNTENILFICAGAFEGLDEIVRKDMPEAQSAFGMPFSKNADVQVTQENIKVDHLMKYGMKAELAGRLGTISVLKGLGREELRKILTEPEDSIVSRYRNEFLIDDNLKLSFTDEAYEAIIDLVMDMNIGARALNSILHEVLAQAMFEAPTIREKEGFENVTEVVISGEVVTEGKAPDYI